MTDEHDDHDSHRDDDGTEYGLVMPFTVVRSKGGPYDDDSFATGWHLGTIDQTLAHLAHARDAGLVAAAIGVTVRAASAPQLDLVAMRHGFVIRRADIDQSGEWATVTIELAP